MKRTILMLCFALTSALNAVAGPPIYLSVQPGCANMIKTKITIDQTSFGFYLNPGNNGPLGGMEFVFMPANGGPSFSHKVPKDPTTVKVQSVGVPSGQFKLNAYLYDINGVRVPNTSSQTYGVTIKSCIISNTSGGVKQTVDTSVKNVQ